MLLLARRAMMPLGRRVALPKLGVPVRPVPLLVRGVVDRALTTGPSSAVQLPRPGDTAWESLNESQQSAAVVLGWSPETWASGMHVPPAALQKAEDPDLRGARLCPHQGHRCCWTN